LDSKNNIKMAKKINLTIAFSMFAILIILLSSFVLAFGVASSYWKGNPLQIAPGQTATVSIRLQNVGSSTDENARVEITNGSEIASIEQKDYLVKAGTKDTQVPIKISIPSDAVPDTLYQVTVTSMTVTSQAGGGVALGVGMDTTFDVLIIPKEEKPTLIAKNLSWIIALIILIVIAIIAVIYIILKKRKK